MGKGKRGLQSHSRLGVLATVDGRPEAKRRREAPHDAHGNRRMNGSGILVNVTGGIHSAGTITSPLSRVGGDRGGIRTRVGRVGGPAERVWSVNRQRFQTGQKRRGWGFAGGGTPLRCGVPTCGGEKNGLVESGGARASPVGCVEDNGEGSNVEGQSAELATPAAKTWSLDELGLESFADGGSPVPPGTEEGASMVEQHGHEAATLSEDAVVPEGVTVLSDANSGPLPPPLMLDGPLGGVGSIERSEREGDSDLKSATYMQGAGNAVVSAIDRKSVV